jgi:hypothetical protein
MISQRISAARGAIAYAEPNRRQQLALERIEFAVGELASVLLSTCRGDIARAAVRDIRRAMAPIHVDILEAD